MKFSKVIKTSDRIPILMLVFGLLVLLAPVGAVAQTNNPPIANDDSVIVSPGEASDPIDVLANDSDEGGDVTPGWVSLFTAPVHGTVDLNIADGTFTYTPTAPPPQGTVYTGPDSFVYQICDPLLLPTPCPTATVSVFVGTEVAYNIIPKKLNVKKKGVIPVAILGTDDFDVTAVNPELILLEDVQPLRWNVAGSRRLNLKYDAQEVVAAIGEVENGDEIVLRLTGKLPDSSDFAGLDTVIIIGKPKHPKK